ncbi:hypothetical protein MRS76_04735 [Rhizobiaceae bacterium n13]|uniref:Uncharacterized protein n=1 Tax=Ferirhizobium litorale TaxID=2927786 RepID=A0AAE3QAH8_9HYPH|nr:hypothetical protein [Fererhizobium litorale]MDI7861253.1 hypothetical protein [Fererhizobium litorale]MDI7921400.1 hypothetical protein [Fererhizobium litorale]
MTSSLILAALTVGLTGLGPHPIDLQRHVQLVADDCGEAAARVVAETGGQLLSAKPAPDGNGCVIIVLVQGQGSERPRRVRVKVPI